MKKQQSKTRVTAKSKISLLLLNVLFSSQVTLAQNNVVVIPMAGDDLRTVYEIGKTGPAGGIVFHVTDGGLHGLEASHEDQSDAEWGCSGINIASIVDLPTATSLDPNTGMHNTEEIIAAGCARYDAADIASSYMGPNGITTGWYLPNKEELNLLYEAKENGILGGFLNDHYWSSSESSTNNHVWAQNFDNGSQVEIDKFSIFNQELRAVRAF